MSSGGVGMPQWLQLSVVGKVDAVGEHGHPSWSEDEAETSRHISDMFLFFRNFMASETPFLLTTTTHGSGAICGINAAIGYWSKGCTNAPGLIF